MQIWADLDIIKGLAAKGWDVVQIGDQAVGVGATGVAPVLRRRLAGVGAPAVVGAEGTSAGPLRCAVGTCTVIPMTAPKRFHVKQQPERRHTRRLGPRATTRALSQQPAPAL